MSTPHPLDILFLTSYSDSCFRTIPAISELADSFASRLTLMNVYDPARSTKTAAIQTLDSFFPEADRFRCCRRVAVPGPLIDAVQKHVETWPVNLIVSPASDPIGLPRIGVRSLRSRLIEEARVPVWTFGRHVRSEKLMQRTRRVACWLDFRADRNHHLPFAIDYAHKLGAELHLLRALPMIHEGSLALATQESKSLHPEGATEEILRMCSRSPLIPHIHVTSGEGRKVLSRMLGEIDADVVFLCNNEGRIARRFGFGLWLDDALPCPAVYIGEQLSVPAWNLDAGPRSRTVTARNGHASWRASKGVSPSLLAELDLI